MLSLPKHLYRTVTMPFNGAVEMLRQAQHDDRCDWYTSFMSSQPLPSNPSQPESATPPSAADWLAIAQRLQALAQAGLAYNPPVFDAERYEEIHALSLQMMSNLSGQPVATFEGIFAAENGYPTPKVDIRAVLFRGTDEVLLVQEKIDGGRWSLPGGWADVGYTPFEVAVKEV